MNRLYAALVRVSRSVRAEVVPHLRQVLRFLALPYCFFATIDWKECTKPRLQVAGDLLYIFFVLRNYPDNYGPCRLWEKPRSTWATYWGSPYNPYQRQHLRRAVWRGEYEILFEDKEVLAWLCTGNDLPAPDTLGVIDPMNDWQTSLKEMIARSGETRVIVKPVRGSAGGGIFLAGLQDGELVVPNDSGTTPERIAKLPERSIVQRLVRQSDEIARFNASSVNTIRTVTLLTRSNDVIFLAAAIRFGVGDVPMDNWSAGGVAAGVRLEDGLVFPDGYDKMGRRFDRHPSSGQVFGDFVIPQWDAVREVSTRVQRAFNLYRLLGHDLAITDDGPVLIEINAFPDLMAEEQTMGPFLTQPEILREFDRWGLLYNAEQKKLLRKLNESAVRAS